MVNAIFDDLNSQTRDRWAYRDTGVWEAARNADVSEREQKKGICHKVFDKEPFQSNVEAQITVARFELYCNELNTACGLLLGKLPLTRRWASSSLSRTIRPG